MDLPFYLMSHPKSLLCLVALFFLCLFPISSQSEPPAVPSVRIGNFLRGAPCGIAWVINDSAAFVLDTGGPYVAGTAAPDESYHEYKFMREGANIVFEWGRVGNNAICRLSSDKQIDLDLSLSGGWPGWKSTFATVPDGVTGVTQSSTGQITWTLRTSPTPKSTSPTKVTVAITPDSPVRIAAGLGGLPDFASVDDILKKAQEKYDAARPRASGEAGDFIAAITDNMNNSRVYSNDNHLLAHSVSRHFDESAPLSQASDANGSPYFCWDSFFTANLASIEDTVGAQNTVRAILSYQTPEGLVPNFAHYPGIGNVSTYRSQPPVGTLCVWKMHQRHPDDLEFLKEVYPKFVRWHDWWPKYRDGKHDGLLEWGDNNADHFHLQGALFETGWDDTLTYTGASMIGITMNAYSIDLCSMWSMDAHYLALIADVLGQKDNAARFRDEQKAMNQRINTQLWNSGMNCYCSRFWNGVGPGQPIDPSAFGSSFDGRYFSDENLQNPVVSHQDTKLDFNWGGQSPIEGVSGTHWSARWKGTFTPPETGMYQFKASADDGFRVFVDGKLIINDWSGHAIEEVTGYISLSQGQSVPVIVEYFQDAGGSELHFSVTRPPPPDDPGKFLTRLSPMNFYVLSAGAPDAERAQSVLTVLTDPKKFWGRYLLPTLAYDDPDYHQQEYWRGDVWGPTNYITWQGIKKYASPAQMTEFADQSVELFMKEWLAKGVCGENYLSTDGTQNHDPHYAWGALLDLIGLENIVDVDDSGQIVLNGAQTKTITLTNIPLLGRIYDVKTSPGTAELIQNGKVILTAKGDVVQIAIP
jgi:hypothetical protein